jgi:gluconate kinase
VSIDEQARTPWSVLILAGPPGAGKNTVAAAIAERLERCAVIDVDKLRGMVVKPHRAPWEGPEGEAQLRLGARNACLLVPIFLEEGFRVVVCDALTHETLAVYRERLSTHSLRVVLLLPSLWETQRRNAGRRRAQVLQAHEVETLYRQHEQLQDIEERIDSTNLHADRVAELLVS